MTSCESPQWALCTIRSHGTKLHILVSKLHSGTSKTKQLVPVHLDLPLFWKSHSATCSLANVILYHVTGSKSLLFECMYACSRSFNDKLTLQRLLNNLLIEFGSKTLNESNSAKNKSIRYFCFVVVVLIYSCHHRLKMSSCSLKRINFGQSI